MVAHTDTHTDTAVGNGVDAVVEKVCSDELPVHSLERELGDCARAVLVRREWLKRQPGVASAEAVGRVPHEGFDYDAVHGACAEMVFGYIPLPVGVAGPLLLNGKTYQVPLATVEGALIASTRRGCKAITAAGGASAAVLSQGMTRAPVIRFPSAIRAAAFAAWMHDPANLAVAQEQFATTTRFGRLTSCRVTVAGRYAYARFVCATGDAMGMNMVSKGVSAVLDFLSAGSFGDLELLGLSGNVCCDKKAAAVNWISGRGCSVVAEATIPGHVVESVLKTTVAAACELNVAKNLIGSAMAGALGGFNAHASNIVTALYLACGQDAAQNVESSQCITLLEPANGGADLHVSVTMPSIEVGTVGGGTILAPQRACLEMLGVAGAGQEAGSHARELATVVAGAVLAGELSLLAALSAGHLMRAHLAHNRKPAAP
ncbi:hydroxymethyglutaryl-CoA reductase [Emiliania huxleyi CCMP1516]|uniref:3-hydroxy-3-methylglutaryl coenzyme A reductase n=4 Tax=Emiliania huxleyi TaxID=2903 RepID=A0A0D3JDC6_EMIH1|nr:hydroxymethyglutaryl-CoA reductase [Emiliania huxleyi CCMP1516]EOD21511.1 hydroxymethyglutaryl-CoA reductase [Emiliania huxleyi CCMP1516]|eukprot:XP_005773940.1 hydroxymethyglutaryl-CoA reductase [Emiliania huxleyi CCMP1516]